MPPMIDKYKIKALFDKYEMMILPVGGATLGVIILLTLVFLKNRPSATLSAKEPSPTPTVTVTDTPTDEPTPTDIIFQPTKTPTVTLTPVPTDTPEPTNSPTDTPVPPTYTPVPPTGTPVPNTPAPGITVSNVTINLSPATDSTYNGSCPHTFTFNGSIFINANGATINSGNPVTVNYKWLRSDPSFIAPLQTIQFTSAGTNIIPPDSSWSLGQTGVNYPNYFEQLSILNPNPITSSQSFFTATCK